MHPVIIREIKKEVQDSLKNDISKLMVIDAPLLFESKLNKYVDKTIVVWVPEKVQINRLRIRDKLSYNQAIKRIRSQMSLEIKKKLSDYVIDNSKSVSKLKMQVRKIYKELLKL